MGTHSLNRNELVEHVAARADMTKADAAAALDALMDGIARALRRGEDVRLVNFGTFSVRERGPGVGRHPVTGAVMPIPAAKNAHFKPAVALKGSLNVRRKK
jgi:DNA-binding protein HU-beta